MEEQEERETLMNTVAFLAPYVAYATVAIGGFAVAKEYYYQEMLAAAGALLCGVAIIGLGLQIRKDGAK